MESIMTLSMQFPLKKLFRKATRFIWLPSYQNPSFTSPCNHSLSLSGFRTHHFFSSLAMAAARLAVITNWLISLNQISQVRSLRCNNGVSLSVSKRLFVCNALLFGMIYHYTWVMVFSILLWKYLKIQVQRWRSKLWWRRK